MLDHKLKKSEIPKIWDNTMLTMFDACERRLYFFLRGIRQKGRPPYFTFGSAWQRALEVWYTSSGGTEERMMLAKDAARRLWMDEAPAAGNEVDTIENLLDLISFYCLSYETEKWTIVASESKMELGFQWPLEGTPYTLAGAIDGFIDWPGIGLLILENKTTRYLTEKYLSQWPFSPQVSQYLWGVRHFVEEPIYGILLNCAGKKLSQDKIKAFKKNGTLPDVFSRIIERRSDEQLIEYQMATLRLLHRVEKCWAELTWDRTRDQLTCAGGMGKATCPYYILCKYHLNPFEMEDLTDPNLYYTEEEWNPWNRGSKLEEE